MGNLTFIVKLTLSFKIDTRVNFPIGNFEPNVKLSESVSISAIFQILFYAKARRLGHSLTRNGSPLILDAFHLILKPFKQNVAVNFLPVYIIFSPLDL